MCIFGGNFAVILSGVYRVYPIWRVYPVSVLGTNFSHWQCESKKRKIEAARAVYVSSSIRIRIIYRYTYKHTSHPEFPTTTASVI